MEQRESLILWNLKKVNLELESVINGLLEDLGLTASQGAILIYVLRHQETVICSAEIHRNFGIARPTVSSLLKKLRQKGYIQFENCPQDDRQKMILATPKGAGVKAALDFRIRSMEQELLRDVTDEEERKMFECFKKLERNLRTYKISKRHPDYEEMRRR